MVTVISTFAGGGGSSLGYKWAGFTELLAIDFDKNSCDTLKANFDFPVWQRDIKEVTVNEILDFLKLKVGELDVLDGSPPCQGFSTAGKRNLNDERNDLFKDYVRLIEGLQPKVFVMENVSGMIKGGYKGKFNEILKTLKDTGYNVKVKLMNAMWYEVPQSRERLFFIGVRKDIGEPSFPEPLKTFITVKEALRDIRNETFCATDYSTKRRGEYLLKDLISKIKQGESAQDHLKSGGFSMIRLNENKCSPTVTKTFPGSNVSLIHPTENRNITIEEAKRLCGFPDNHKLNGTFREQWSRLGNAVMPKMMYHIAKNIKEKILEKH